MINHIVIKIIGKKQSTRLNVLFSKEGDGNIVLFFPKGESVIVSGIIMV